jgi:hypothetical protein
MNTAAKVRQERTLHPERFCTRCLWRIAKKSGPSPCPRHPIRPMGAAVPWEPNTFDLLENAAKRRAQHAAMWLPSPSVATCVEFANALLAAPPTPAPSESEAKARAMATSCLQFTVAYLTQINAYPVLRDRFTRLRGYTPEQGLAALAAVRGTP